MSTRDRYGNVQMSPREQQRMAQDQEEADRILAELKSAFEDFSRAWARAKRIARQAATEAMREAGAQR